MSAEAESGSATAQGFSACHVCTAVVMAGSQRCRRCGSHIHASMDLSIQKTLAWLITSIVFYIPANILPIMRTEFLGRETTNTLLGGVITLWEHHSYPIAIVIFVASVLVPLLKILVIAWLCATVMRGSSRLMKQKTVLYRITEFVGRWSMVDVFVIGILVALIRLGKIMSIYPGAAALAFAGMVVCTMLAAMAFDPKLIWRPVNEQTVRERETA